MNAIDLLIRQHRTLEAALRAGRDAEASKRAPTVTRLADDLGKHMSSEEQVSIPRCVRIAPKTYCSNRWRSIFH